jgi:predicted ATPase
MISFKFENLGPIEKGSIKLNNLNIICGENNSGKTYINYLIYTILHVINNSVDYYSNIFDELNIEDNSEVDIEPFINSYIENYISEIEKKVKNILPNIFNSDSSLFKDFSIKIVVDIEKLVKEIELIGGIADYTINNYEIHLSKDSDSLKIQLNRIKNKEKIKKNILKEKEKFCSFINECIMNQLANKIFTLPAERSGLSLFYRNLLSNRNDKLHKLISSNDKNLELVSAIENEFVKYPKPINDYINFLADLSSSKEYENNNQIYNELINEIENEIIQGKYSIKNNRIIFTNNEKIELEFHMVSSLVKTFVGLTYYLKNLPKGAWIIIDEPELNLHPDNQRKIAQMFACLANNGINIVMTTHSPYITEEINNLIKLSNKEINDKKKEYLMKKYNIKKNEILEKENISAYLIKSGKTEEMEKTDFGITTDTFNEVIDSLNNFSDDYNFYEEDDGVVKA